MVFEGFGEDNNVVQIRDAHLATKISETALHETWKLAGTFVNPKGMRIHSYNPHGVIKALSG